MFYERIQAACAAKNTTMTELLREFGMASSNTGKWKNGNAPGTKTLSKFAERLDVSVDYLLGKADIPISAEKKEASPGSIDPKEALRQRLVGEGVIASDRPMTDDEWNAILAYAETLVKRGDK